MSSVVMVTMHAPSSVPPMRACAPEHPWWLPWLHSRNGGSSGKRRGDEHHSPTHVHKNPPTNNNMSSKSFLVLFPGIKLLLASFPPSAGGEPGNEAKLSYSTKSSEKKTRKQGKAILETQMGIATV